MYKQYIQTQIIEYVRIRTSGRPLVETGCLLKPRYNDNNNIVTVVP